MPAALRTKKAMDIAYQVMGIPVQMRDSYKKPRERVVRSTNSDLSRIHADDTGVGRRFV